MEFIIYTALLGALYFAPTMAAARGRRGSVFVLNLFLGLDDARLGSGAGNGHAVAGKRERGGVMAGQFKVGEILVGQNFIMFPEFNGAECIVLHGLEPRATRNRSTGEMTYDAKYVVQWDDGQVDAIRPFNLRRKQPPSGEKSVLDMFKLPTPKREREPA